MTDVPTRPPSASSSAALSPSCYPESHEFMSALISKEPISVLIVVGVLTATVFFHATQYLFGFIWVIDYADVQGGPRSHRDTCDFRLDNFSR